MTQNAIGLLNCALADGLNQVRSPASHSSVTRAAQSEIFASAAKRNVRRSSKFSTKVALSLSFTSGLGQPSKRDIHIRSPHKRWHKVPWSEPQNTPQCLRR